MAVKIRVPGALRQLTRGAAIVEVDAGDVSQALDELNQKFPGFKERLYDDKGELRQFINIYRNDEDIRFGSGLKTPLKDSDDLSIVSSVAAERQAHRRPRHCRGQPPATAGTMERSSLSFSGVFSPEPKRMSSSFR